MRDALLDYLRCPACSSPLAYGSVSRDAAHVVRGELACTKATCGARYPIVDGVPDFVTSSAASSSAASASSASASSAASSAAFAASAVDQTTSGFATNWQRYSDVILAQPALNDELFRDWITPLLPERFEGKRVLDAGCGMGRWLAAAAPHAPSTLVGFDYSEVAHAAFNNTRHLKNVHVVRADIFRLPFATSRAGATRENGMDQNLFDVCYSIGVVHHTPDPEGAFAALLDALKPDGVLAVWVYGKENNEWIENVVSPIRRLLTSRLPDPALYAITKMLTLQLSLAAKSYARAFPSPTTFSYDAYARHLLRYPRAYLEHIVYDHLVPQLAHYLPREDVERWASSRALAYSLTSRNANSWRLIAARTAAALKSYTAQ